MDDIDRTFEMVDVLDFHLKHTDLFRQQTRDKLVKHILKKIDDHPDYLFESGSPFKTVYPNLFRTSNNSTNE